ncbi:hypothetical protein D3C78_1465240 [compost metagenome]
MEVVLSQAEMRGHTLVEPQVRLKQAVQSYSGGGFATGHQAGAVKQRFVELLDQFKQQFLFAIDVVVEGAGGDPQASGQVAHADSAETMPGEQLDSLVPGFQVTRVAFFVDRHGKKGFGGLHVTHRPHTRNCPNSRLS